MNKLIQLVCLLAEKIDRLIGRLDREHNKQVNAIISPVTIGDNTPRNLASRNPRRVGLIIHNNSSGVLFVALATDQVSPTFYSFAIQPQEHLILDQDRLKEYKKAAIAVWSSTAGSTSFAMVTELFKEDTQ